MRRSDFRTTIDSVLRDATTAIIAFWLLGLASSVVVIVLVQFSPAHRALVWWCLGVAALIALARILGRHRLPEGTTHVDIVMATALISLIIAVTPSNFNVGAVFYVWVAVFVGLYYSARSALSHVALIGVAYAFVAAQSMTLREGLAAWLAVTGTAAALTLLAGTLVGELRSASHRDPLTQLANRRTWNERIIEEIERARRYATPLSVASIDVDNFKSVNDRLGHQAGDQLLRQLAHEWSEAIRDSGDFLARLGGDEFGLLAPGSNDEDIVRIAERLAERQPAGTVCSIGVATWDGVEDAESLYARADQRMFEVKQRHHHHD